MIYHKKRLVQFFSIAKPFMYTTIIETGDLIYNIAYTILLLYIFDDVATKKEPKQALFIYYFNKKFKTNVEGESSLGKRLDSSMSQHT